MVEMSVDEMMKIVEQKEAEGTLKVSVKGKSGICGWMEAVMVKMMKKDERLSGKMPIGGWKDVLESVLVARFKAEGKEVSKEDVEINWSSIRYVVKERKNGAFALDASGRVCLKSLMKKAAAASSKKQ